MTAIFDSIKGAWQAYTALGVVVVGLLAYSRMPAQVTDHETRIQRLEEFQRFQGCWMLEQAAGRDPNPCRYILSNPDDFRPPYTIRLP